MSLEVVIHYLPIYSFVGDLLNGFVFINMNLLNADFTLQYNGKDISTDISEHVLSITYTDKLKTEADELVVSLEDATQLWQNAWYPDKGATLQLFIRSGGQQLNAGVFTIDEIEGNGSTSGDTIAIKAIGATFNKSLRTSSSRAHENKSLREIANTVAASLGLTVQGNIQDIRPTRIHQYRESALSFLNRLAAQYGYFFSIRGNLLIFQQYRDIESRAPSLTFKRADLIRWTVKDNTMQTYNAVRIRYHFPKEKKVIGFSAGSRDSGIVSGDSLELHGRCENQQQAQLMAEYALHQSNGRMVKGEIETMGNLLLISGNTVKLQEIGKFSGVFLVDGAHHTISRDGSYKTSASIYRVNTIKSNLG
jgi:phage protein D